jgi:two-component system LytT family response regulator
MNDARDPFTPLQAPIRVWLAASEPLRQELSSALAAGGGFEILNKAGEGAEARFCEIGFRPAPGPGVQVWLVDAPEIAVWAFEQGALDCLLKPLSAGALQRAMRRVREEVTRRRSEQLLRSVAPAASMASLPPSWSRRMVFREGPAMVFLRDEEINWVQADGDFMRFHTPAKQHEARMTLDEVERRLDPARFIRIHRSTLVNLDRVEKFCFQVVNQPAAVMHDGTRLKVGFKYRRLVRRLLAKAG